MFALCVESSHARGMGHLFRALRLGEALARRAQPVTILINAHEPALRILKGTGLPFETVDPGDTESAWERELIARLGARLWIDDRLNTDARHAAHVKGAGIPLVTFDDRGTGAAAADLNIAALAFEPDAPLGGRRVLRGLEYLVLDPAIARHQRLRKRADRVLVTLGGSDTYGVTIQVVRALRAAGRAATVVVGPGFAHERELAAALDPAFEVKRGVPSLIEEFERQDVAITGGGITPFEANASGLPCVVIATEPWEVANGRALEKLGSSRFAGHRTAIDERLLTADLPVEEMSGAGMSGIGIDGAERVAAELVLL